MNFGMSVSKGEPTGFVMIGGGCVQQSMVYHVHCETGVIKTPRVFIKNTKI